MITPWSWTTSNGTATAMETRLSYLTATSHDLTAIFSYKVWNDLIRKIREVQVALNRTWNPQHATLASTMMNFVYDILYDTTFNAAVQNTLYPLWTWSYMQNKVGYIGRTEVRGVRNYGEAGADTVYGWYIIELADRLNVVIGIINGTTPTKEARVQLQNILQPDAQLRAPATAPFRVAQPGVLLSSGKMEAQNLPTMNARAILNSPTARAFLELDELSAMMEAHARMGIEHNGKLIYLPSVRFIEMLHAVGGADGTLRGIPSKAALADAFQQIAEAAEANHSPSMRISIAQVEWLDIERTAHALPTVSGWIRAYEMLEARSKLTSERTSELTVRFQSGPVARAAMRKNLPQPFSAEFADAIAQEGNLGLGDIQPFGVDSVISELGGAAVLGYSENKDMNAALILDSPAAYAKLEYDHVSTMLRAYLEMLCTEYGQLDNLPSANAENAEVIHLLLPETLVAGHSGSGEYHHDIRVDIVKHANTAIAAHCIYPCEIEVSISDTAHTAHSATTGHTVHYTVEIGSRTMHATLCRALGSSRVRAAHTISGTAHYAPPIGAAAFLLVPLADVSGEMNTVRERILGSATAAGVHGIAGNLDVLHDLLDLTAAAEDEIRHGAALGYVFNRSAEAELQMALIHSAYLEAESQHRWQYPTIIGNDMTVYQVYRTESNRDSMWLDPHLVQKWQQLTMAPSANIDRQVRASAIWNGDIGVNIDSTMNAVERAAWEYPIQTDDELLIRQAVRTYKPKTNTLEVT